MIDIFVICYHFITNSYSKVKGLVLPEAGDVNAPLQTTNILLGVLKKVQIQRELRIISQ